jgi:hypothetical protein
MDSLFRNRYERTDPYVFRNQMTLAIITSWGLRRNDLDENAPRTRIQQWRKVAPDYYGDYYPLTRHRLDLHAWAAMQFNRP